MSAFDPKRRLAPHPCSGTLWVPSNCLKTSKAAGQVSNQRLCLRPQCAGLGWPPLGCRTGNGPALPFKRGRVPSDQEKIDAVAAVLRQVDRHPYRKKAVTFDPNQKWLRVVTNDNFFDFKPAHPFGYFPRRRERGENADAQARWFPSGSPIRSRLRASARCVVIHGLCIRRLAVSERIITARSVHVRFRRTL